MSMATRWLDGLLIVIILLVAIGILSVARPAIPKAQTSYYATPTTVAPTYTLTPTSIADKIATLQAAHEATMMAKWTPTPQPTATPNYCQHPSPCVMCDPCGGAGSVTVRFSRRYGRLVEVYVDRQYLRRASLCNYVKVYNIPAGQHILEINWKNDPMLVARGHRFILQIPEVMTRTLEYRIY